MNVDSKRLVFRIQGLDCAEEVAILKRELQPLVGTPERLAFDILNGKLIILPGNGLISTDAVIQAVARTGMRAKSGGPIKEDLNPQSGSNTDGVY